MSRLRGSVLILAVVCAAVTAHGQAVTANLQGVVSDASGAVVAGATASSSEETCFGAMDHSLYRALAESASTRRGRAVGSAGEGHSPKEEWPAHCWLICF